MIKQEAIRSNRKGFSACAECRQHGTACSDGKACAPANQQLRDYGGVRFTSDGFDCALPVCIDSHSFCSFGCLYCFAPNLVQKRSTFKRPIGQASLTFVEGIFSGKGKSLQAKLYRETLKYDAKQNGYPCPVQLGAIADPLDNIERHQGWFLHYTKIANQYNQPTRISTKGNLFLEDEYLRAVAAKPELYFVLFSIPSIDDGVLAKLDRRAPSATERIESMRRLSKAGVRVGLRMRPILAGIGDATKDHPQAYKELIERCADAGAEAISYEVGFVPGQLTKELRERWKEIEKISGVPYIELYRSFGKVEACTRPSWKWTERIMHAVYKEAKRHKMVVGISDPLWKQLGEAGCCCGFMGDDPVFGNWQRESATNRLLEARDGKRKTICAKDIIPEWSKRAQFSMIANPGVGPTVVYMGRHSTWADRLNANWNDTERERSPLRYFQGALMPCRKKGCQVHYEYKGLKRQHLTPPYWKLPEDD